MFSIIYIYISSKNSFKLRYFFPLFFFLTDQQCFFFLSDQLRATLVFPPGHPPEELLPNSRLDPPSQLPAPPPQLPAVLPARSQNGSNWANRAVTISINFYQLIIFFNYNYIFQLIIILIHNYIIIVIIFFLPLRVL